MNALPLTSGLAKLGGKVITRTSARRLTVSDNPNCVQLSPNFAKPLGCYLQATEDNEKIELNIRQIINRPDKDIYFLRI